MRAALSGESVERAMTPPDILIVGAGVAGLSLATALGREGFCVTVIDGAQRPKPPTADRAITDWDLRVSALTPASITFLEGLGAWSAIPDDRTGCYTGMKVWDGHGSGRIRFDASEVNAPYLGHIVENRLTLQALLQCAETCPGVEVLWGCAMDAMTLTDSGWEIHCEDGSTFCAPLTVGADGARSRVREWAAMPTRDWSYEQSAIVGTVTLASHHQDACWQAFLDTGPLALLPLADEDKVAIVWSLDELQHEQIAALSNEAFLSALNRALGDDVPRAEAVGPRASFPLKQSHAVDYIDDGLVLVADAAHSIHPLAGQGINLGLSDVRVLAAELTAGKATGLAVDSPIALKRYQRQRKTENLAMMAAMEGFKRGFGSQNPLAVVARNVGLSLVDQQAWLKRWFMGQALS